MNTTICQTINLHTSLSTVCENVEGKKWLSRIPMEKRLMPRKYDGRKDCFTATNQSYHVATHTMTFSTMHNTTNLILNQNSLHRSENNGKCKCTYNSVFKVEVNGHHSFDSELRICLSNFIILLILKMQHSLALLLTNGLQFVLQQSKNTLYHLCIHLKLWKYYFKVNRN